MENLVQTNEPAPAWKGEYRYDLVVKENAPDGPSAEEGDEQPKAKRPAPRKARGVSAIVLMTGLMTKSAAEMTEEERAAQGPGEIAVRRDASLGGKPGPEMEKAAEALGREIAAVTPAQMETFLKTNLAGDGALDVTYLKLTGEQDEHSASRWNAKPGPRPCGSGRTP